MGSQRIVSKLGSSDIFTIRNPLTDTTANNQNFVPKLTDLTGKIKVRFDSLGVVYKGTSQGNVGMITSTAGRIPTPLKYYFHSDHLGSSSLITDATGGIVQHLEYIPFGEVFIDERAATSTWSTPYKFNAKELDEETGLYYYGARYYDPRTSVWISVDPLAEYYPNAISYNYCGENPVIYTDPDGRGQTLIGSFWQGIKNSAMDFYHGTKQIITHPVQTINSTSTIVNKAINNPVKTGFKAAEIVDNTIDKFNNGDADNKSEMLGYGTLEVGMLVLPALDLTKGVSIAGKVEKITALTNDVDKTENLISVAWQSVSGIVRDASKGKGNFGLGSATYEEAMVAGKSWVGDGYRIASDGKTLVSKDELRTFRSPTLKPKLGKIQVNFEWKSLKGGQPQGNGHLDIIKK